MTPTPEGTSRWYQMLLPIAQAGGPVLTLFMAVLLVVSLWWGLGILRECVQHNRTLGAQLVTQQQSFHAEILMRLAHCPPVR